MLTPRHLLNSVLAAALLVWAGSLQAQPPTSHTPPQMAVYRWAAQPANTDAYSQWIGKPVWAEDFLPTEKWDALYWPNWLLGPWSEWVSAKEGRRLIVSVPLLPGSWDCSGPQDGIDAKKPVSLEAGAKGEYNKHFEALAHKLVEAKLGNTILRLGWEFNGGWYNWRAGGQEKAFAGYFGQIVKTMRAVPGAEKLKFCWNPAQAWLQFPAENAYPGDDVVDYVGLDLYDQSWDKDTYPFPKDATPEEILARQKKTWNEVIYDGNHGLKFWRDFAVKHKKPFCLPEWGLCKREDTHGGMDNPYFIEQMHAFIMDPANNVAFHCYFDVQAPDGGHQLSPGLKGDEKIFFPQSAAKYRELFGSQKNSK